MPRVMTPEERTACERATRELDAEIDQAMADNQTTEECAWKLDDIEWNAWATSCGNQFVIECGSPKDNSFRFCCYCGKTVRETADA